MQDSADQLGDRGILLPADFGEPVPQGIYISQVLLECMDMTADLAAAAIDRVQRGQLLAIQKGCKKDFLFEKGGDLILGIEVGRVAPIAFVPSQGPRRRRAIAPGNALPRPGNQSVMMLLLAMQIAVGRALVEGGDKHAPDRIGT